MRAKAITCQTTIGSTPSDQDLAADNGWRR